MNCRIWALCVTRHHFLRAPRHLFATRSLCRFGPWVGCDAGHRSVCETSFPGAAACPLNGPATVPLSPR